MPSLAPSTWSVFSYKVVALLVVRPTVDSFNDPNAGTGKIVSRNAFGNAGYNGAQVSTVLQNGSPLIATISRFVNNETSAFVNGTASASTEATASTYVGTAAITSSTIGLSADNYLITFTDGTLTIGNRAVSTAADTNKAELDNAIRSVQQQRLNWMDELAAGPTDNLVGLTLSILELRAGFTPFSSQPTGSMRPT